MGALVNAYPQPSTKYQETVCCAGITASGQLRRRYPTVYRQLQPDQRFDRFGWIEANMNRAPGDPRPKSYRVDQGTLRVLGSGKRARPESKARMLLPHAANSLNWHYEEHARTGQSLGIVRPDPGTLRFRWHPLSQAHENDTRFRRAENKGHTSSGDGFQYWMSARFQLTCNEDKDAATPRAKARRSQQYDLALELLERALSEPAPMRCAAMDRLTAPYDGRLDLHEALLKLSAATGGGHRLVTTNFDDRFQRASTDRAWIQIGPRLAPPRKDQWRHLTYLHGVGKGYPTRRLSRHHGIRRQRKP